MLTEDQIQAGIVSLADFALLSVEGPDAATFLQNINTNDVKNLPVGQACKAYFCDRTAKVIAQAMIYRLKNDLFYIASPPSCASILRQHMEKHWISEQIAIEAVAGQSLWHVPGKVKTGASTLPMFANRRYISPGWDVFLPADQAVPAEWSAQHPVLTPAETEILRIESLTPIYGLDIDDKRFVMELPDALEAVNYQKGCFLGQEPIIMSRDRAGFVNRSLRQLFSLRGEAIPLHADVTTADGQKIGLTTGSGVYSPRYAGHIALAYLKRGFQEPGQEFVIGEHAVRVLPLPGQ